ncbi:MAG: GntR family transcriptional regulator [Streptosporangiaceae bacterium]
MGRTTVREALKELESEGAVQVRRGRGRFVSSAPPVLRPITRLESVTEMLAAQGYTVVNRVLSVRTRQAIASEREQLALEPGSEVVQLERLRLAGKDPLIYSLDVLPAGLLMVQLHLIDDGTPVLYSHDYYRGDRFSFEVLRRVEAKA